MTSAASTEQPAVIVRGASDVPLIIPEQAKLGTILGSEQLIEGGLPRMRSKVAIVGFAPSSMEDVKFVWDDPDMEIWGINQLYMAFPKMAEKATRWFQIHHRHSYDACVTRDHSHHEWLAKQTKFPIYMQKKEPDISMSIKFPVIEILQKFRRYFTNSISWEIAVAILEGFKEVHLYGVDMAQDCIVPETKVLRNDLRWVPASAIKVGDRIIGFDEHSGKKTEGPHAYRQWRNSIVEEANRFKRPCYRLNFADGSFVVASAGHLWLTYAEHEMRWKRTDEMVTNLHRHPTKITKLVDTWKEDRSWEAGYLAAALDGEGWLTQDVLGTMHHKDAIPVISAEFLGDQEVIGFKTSTKTFIAEGLASHNSEYAFERPSVEYFLGYLEGTGSKLVLPDKCDLCKSMWLYPFEDDAPFRAKVEARRQELRGRLNQSINQESQGHDMRLQVLGALDDLNYIEKTWGSAAKNLEGVGFYEPPKQGE